MGKLQISGPERRWLGEQPPWAGSIHGPVDLCGSSRFSGGGLDELGLPLGKNMFSWSELDTQCLQEHVSLLPL